MRQHRFFMYLVVALMFLGISAAPAPHLVVDIETPNSSETEAEADQCLVCHTDKDSLVSSAKAEEHVESEYEGDG